MAIYIPLDKALEMCDTLAKGFHEKGILTHRILTISPKDFSYIIGAIASKYGKYIQEDGDIAFAPQIMPESSDPAGSTRYHRFIVNEKRNASGEYRVSFPNDPAENGVFFVKEYSPEFSEYSSQSGNGVVLKEADGSYSWWFDDMSK
ncbi:MAG: hypothetical protein ACI4WS_05945 [Oscillospiraceae bacterium]